MTKTPAVIYMHGFASGPSSTKAVHFDTKFKELGIEMVIPDLNHPSFESLTLTRQLNSVRELIEKVDHDVPIVLIGSSMGGLIATLAAQSRQTIAALILMAPGFGIEKRWTRLVGEEGRIAWAANGVLDVYHYATKSNQPLGYSFVKDLANYSTQELRINVPALVFHGTHDDVVPFEGSVNFARTNKELVKLIELDDGHELIAPLDQIWNTSRAFLFEHSFSSINCYPYRSNDKTSGSNHNDFCFESKGVVSALTSHEKHLECFPH